MAKSQTVHKEPAAPPPSAHGATVVNPTTGEVVAIADAGKSLVPFVPPSVKVKKLVTIPVIKVPDGATICFSPVEPFKRGKEIEKDKRVADLLTVKTFDPDGKLVTRVLVAGAIVKSEIEEQYPKTTYVGLWFILRKMKGPEGKRYKVYDIAEIEAPDIA